MLDALWSVMQYQVFCSREDFEASLAGCDVRQVVRGGKIVAVLIYRGPEFHFVPTSDYRITRRDIMDALGVAMRQYGHVTTRTPIDDVRQQRFNERFGFVRTGEDDEYVFYKYVP